MEFKHYSVMSRETVEYLDIKPDGIYVDCTFGGGGHSRLILDKLADGRIIGVDRDPDAVENGKRVFNDSRLTLVNENFENVSTVLDTLGIEKISGAVMDLGVSSYQLDTVERGFSYSSNAPLDMRMDTNAPLDAKTVVNTYTEDELTRVFKEYGEERFSKNIARRIVRERANKEFETTSELFAAVFAAAQAKSEQDKLYSVKRIFQAVRIEVNGELEVIGKTINAITSRLERGGRLVVISFHSLEDRIVKNEFRRLESPCRCPKDFPICVCGEKPQIRILTKKPLVPSERENEENTRSHSAKLRACEKI